MTTKAYSLVLATSLAVLSACETVPSGSAESTSVNTQASTPSTEQVEAVAFANPIVTPEFKTSGGSGDGFRIRIRYTGIEASGEVYICGAVTTRGIREATQVARQSLGRSRITANGQTILSGLSFFRMASGANFTSALVGVDTGCRATGVPSGTIDLDSVQIEGGEGSFRVRAR